MSSRHLRRNYRIDHWPCPGGCGMLADECECHRPRNLRSVAQAGTVCIDAGPSMCSGGATYNGRCGKHAARARRFGR